jgi:chromosome segregation ATPase
LQRVRSCLSEICASQGEFDRFFCDVFDQLDVLSGQLLRHQQAWQTERSEAEQDYQRRCEQLAEHRAEVAARQDQLHTEANAAEAGIAAQADDRLQQALDQIAEQRTALASALEEAQRQTGELAHATAELEQTRQQFQELLPPAGTASLAGVAEAVQEQLHQVQRERDELQKERAQLEAELEAVRNRAAEMTESLAQQKREIAQERGQWAEEIKRLRHLLESLSTQPAAPARESDSPPASSAEARGSSKSPNGESDPVLDSVLAQFELLQKDLARRRKQPAANPG